MKSLGLLVCACVAIVPSTAQAHTDVISPNPIYQKWVDQSLVPTPDESVLVTEDAEACHDPLAVACTAPLLGIFVDPAYVSSAGYTLQFAFFHELGHRFDYWTLGSSGRQAFEWVEGSSGPWQSESDSSLSETFASDYSNCAIYGSAADTAEICSIINRAGRKPHRHKRRSSKSAKIFHTGQR